MRTPEDDKRAEDAGRALLAALESRRSAGRPSTSPIERALEAEYRRTCPRWERFSDITSGDPCRRCGAPEWAHRL